MAMNSSDWLTRALEESRARGFLGPSDIEPQVNHALGFVRCWEEVSTRTPECLLDLGSGGGLPGLVLLEQWGCRTVLLDSMIKRSDFLRDVLSLSGAPVGGEVISARAEEAARWPEFDGAFDLVTARSFGPPSVTAECGVRFLREGGYLVVSEPPSESATERWNVDGLESLGLVSLGRRRYGSAYEILRKNSPTPPLFPRSTGTPKKKPLF